MYIIYVYVYTFVYICMCIYMHVFINIYIYENIYIYIIIYIYIRIQCECIIYVYVYVNGYLYTLKVQCWCLPTHFTNVEVYPHICIIMSMFTHQCRCLPLRHEVQQFYEPFVLLPDHYLGHASLVKLMRYLFESHLTHIFPYIMDFVSFSLNDALYVCIRAGVLP